MKTLIKQFCTYCALAVLSVVTVGAQTTQPTYWWNDAVFYEVFVRSFKDSDGDGQGDLKGLISKLDYLNDGDPSTHHDLGVTALWLMPLQQSPSYHGYDVTDYRTIEADYGTNADFAQLMTEAHNRGIKVIIDYVMNHTSSQHPWFTASTNATDNKRDWYVWQNPKPVMTGPWGQSVWYPKNASNYYAIFWSEMPDLNYSTPAVKEEMFDVARFWLEEMHVDGFRLDAIKYIDEDGSTVEDTPETIQFWKDFRAEYKSMNADALAVGEAWTATEKVAAYADGNGVDYCFEFDLADSIIKAANTGDPACLRTQMDKVMTTYPFLQFGTFLTNHDINRVIDRLSKSSNKAKLAADLLLTLPGVPYIYYGEEIGMNGSGVDENKRTPLQWSNTTQGGFTTGTPWRAVNTDFTTKNIAAQQQDATSVWNNYRRLIALRKNQTALRKGTYKTVSASTTPVFAFLRQHETEHLLVVSNTGSAIANNIELTHAAAGIAPGNYVWVELLGGTTIPVVIDNNGGFTSTVTQIASRKTVLYKLMLASATTSTVMFEVDMTQLITDGHFNPATETVDIVADFNNFGASGTTVLSDLNADGKYTVAIPSAAIGSTIHYKYRINAINDGREEFPSSAFVREYLVLEGTVTVKDKYQLQTITGIQHLLQQGISLYPVPADQEVVIAFSEVFHGDMQYQITDLVGEEKEASSFVALSKAGQHSISCEGLPAGYYLLTLTYNGAKQAFRFVVQ